MAGVFVLLSFVNVAFSVELTISGGETYVFRLSDPKSIGSHILTTHQAQAQLSLHHPNEALSSALTAYEQVRDPAPTTKTSPKDLETFSAFFSSAKKPSSPSETVRGYVAKVTCEPSSKTL